MGRSEKYDFSGYNPLEYAFNIEDMRFTLVTYNSKTNVNYNDRIKNMHFHRFYEIFAPVVYDLEIRFENEIIFVPKGCMVCIPPDVIHTAIGGPGRVNHMVRFYIEKTSVKSDFPIFDTVKKIFSKPYRIFKIGNEIGEIVEQLNSFGRCINILNKNQLMFLIYNFVCRLILADESNSEQQERFNTSPTGNMSRYFHLDMLLSDGYSKNITLKQIADALYVSERQASRIIHDIFGCTFSEIINSKRMQTASNMLANSDMSISDIATKVGYSSVKGFYSAFKKHFGCLPLAYRKNFSKIKHAAASEESEKSE